jgi:GNAT superfamily N-acetyltransferase
LVEDGVVFDAAQLMAQQAVFAEGQIVVEDAGVVVGAIATLVVPSSAALAPHSWVEITSHGTFASHDPRGDALYLADIYVSPTAQNRGIGKTLYDALFRLCERRRLSRVVAGGRLWGYHEVQDQVSPAQYVDEVVRGVRRDQVLTSQLRAGFSVSGVLDGYLDDWRSGSFATHLVWENRLVKSRDARTQDTPAHNPAKNLRSRSPALLDGVHEGRRSASEGWHGVNEGSELPS